eukprot:scaffold33919_cov45-Attheya_sp.AAC.3
MLDVLLGRLRSRPYPPPGCRLLLAYPGMYSYSRTQYGTRSLVADADSFQFVRKESKSMSHLVVDNIFHPHTPYLGADSGSSSFCPEPGTEGSTTGWLVLSEEDDESLESEDEVDESEELVSDSEELSDSDDDTS